MNLDVFPVLKTLKMANLFHIMLDKYEKFEVKSKSCKQIMLAIFEHERLNKLVLGKISGVKSQ